MTDQYLQDLEDIMQTDGGRRFIYRLLDDCNADSADLCQDAYNLGRRSVGMKLLQDIRSLPEGLNLEMAMRIEARAQPQKESRDDIYDKFVK